MRSLFLCEEERCHYVYFFVVDGRDSVDIINLRSRRESSSVFNQSSGTNISKSSYLRCKVCFLILHLLLAMSTGRLSPAANLLRNSKLFALPQNVPLPQQRPTFEPTNSSDTATSIHPTKAAIVSPPIAYTKGDWGLKRELPGKATASTSTPTIRLRGEYDAQEHITDFESASDHVVTLEKWRTVTMQMIPPKRQQAGFGDRRTFSVFHPAIDNTTNVHSDYASIDARTSDGTPEHLKQALGRLREQRRAKAEAEGLPLPGPPPKAPSMPLNRKRWKYEGPWLAGMTNFEFEGYLQDLGGKTIIQFRDQLRKKILQDRRAKDTAARDAQDVVDTSDATIKGGEKSAIQVTEEDLDNAMRRLRQEPEAFGAEIASFLDLPEGPDPVAEVLRLNGKTPQWLYNRKSVAADPYRTFGPPRTHPSVGFSYVRTNQYARNDPEKGPSRIARPMPARVLREQQAFDESRAFGGANKTSVGVGGLVARVEVLGIRNTMPPWQPQPGGPKMVVKSRDHNATVLQSGAIDLVVAKDGEHALNEHNVPENIQEKAIRERARTKERMPAGPSRMEPLDEMRSRPRSTQYRKQTQPKADDGEMREMLRRMRSGEM